MSEKKQEEKFLFSEKLRNTMAPFKDMSCAEALQSESFMRALCKHGGMADEKFEEIKRDCREKKKNMTQEEIEEETDQTLAEVEKKMPELLKIMKGKI